MTPLLKVTDLRIELVRDASRKAPRAILDGGEKPRLRSCAGLTGKDRLSNLRIKIGECFQIALGMARRHPCPGLGVRGLLKATPA